jgi:hypothetical protein
MENQGEKTNGLRGIAALFNDVERKEIFRKYLYFLGWVEILLLLTCWLYQIGDSGHDGAESTFPWRLYFIIAFLAPVGISFLLGIIIIGFNKYFAEAGPVHASAAEEQSAASKDGNEGRIEQLNRMVVWVQRLPFLALLLLLALAVGFFYKLDVIVGLVGSIGEKSVKVVLISAGVILILISVFALILVVLNFQLRKRAMEYQYKSQVAERFGLIILEDNTVLNSEGKLLVNGKKWKDSVRLLPEPVPEPVKEDKPSESAGSGTIPRPVDLET